MPTNELQTLSIDRLTSELEGCWDWEDRYQYIIGLGRKLPPLADDERSEANYVHGCQSQLWLLADVERGDATPPRLYFRAESDSLIVKGLAALVVAIYSGMTPAEIAAYDIHSLFDRIELTKHLSPMRGNGVKNLIDRIHTIAASHSE